MDYGEYWLLETAADGGVPLTRAWGTPRSLKAQWNKRPHEMSLGEVVETLVRLFRDGDILAREMLVGRDADADAVAVRDDSFVPTPKEIVAGLTYSSKRTQRGVGLYYLLTPSGGKRWETHARADWRRFFRSETREIDTGASDESMSCRHEIMTVWAADRARIDYLVDAAWRWWPDIEYDPGAISVAEVAPWQATYWKTLPRAWRAEFPIRCVDVNEWRPPPRVLKQMEHMTQEKRIAFAKREFCEIYHWHDGFRAENA